MPRRRTENLPEPSDALAPALPEGWCLASLRDVTKDVPGIRPEHEPDRAFKYADISSIDNRRSRIVSLKSFSGRDAPSRARRPVRPGDVLFSNVRTYLRNVALIEQDPVPDVCSTGFTVLRSNGAVLPRYLLRYVLTDDFIDRVSETQTGTHYPATSDRQVLSRSLPLPPLAEQERIVSLLERLLAKVDACRDRLDRVPEILSRLRQAVLAAACSGKLTEEWRRCTSHDPTPPADSALDLKEEFDLPEIPESWSWVRLGDVSDIRGGIQKQPKRAPRNNAFPFLRVLNVRRGQLDLGNIAKMELFDGELDTYRLQPGDLLIVEGNGSLTEIGRSAVWGGEIRDCVHQNHIIRVRPRLASTHFLDYYWNSSLGRRNVATAAVTSSGLYSLSTGKIASLPVPLPPRREQEELVRRVDEFLVLVTNIQRLSGGAAKRSERAAQTVLSRAFRGELVLTEAELAAQEGRTYESAGELLQRLRLRRAST